MACFFLGLWLAGGFTLAIVHRENYTAVDRLLESPNPAAAAQFKTLGPAGARLLLRYQASEQDRWYAESWGTLQLVLGSLFFLFLLFGTREGKFSLLMVLFMIGTVALQRFVLTPEIAAVGRILDFPPAGMPGHAKLQILRHTYLGLELLKWALGMVLTAELVVRHDHSGDTWDKFDLIDKSDHRHVDW